MSSRGLDTPEISDHERDRLSMLYLTTVWSLLVSAHLLTAAHAFWSMFCKFCVCADFLLLFLLLPLMTIGHKAGRYCHFRVQPNVNSDTGRKKREEFWNLLGGGWHRLEGAKGGRQNCIQGKFVPVPDCAGAEGVASVVGAAAEALVLEAVVASSSTCWLEFEVRAPHTRTSGVWERLRGIAVRNLVCFCDYTLQ